MPVQRADARRNYALVLAVAEREVSARGANASLEQIARIAGVGSATVRRHFPTRAALLAAVSRARIEALSERARSMVAAGGRRDALLSWLSEVMDYCVSARGLAAALNHNPDSSDSADQPGEDCSASLEQAATPLLERAVHDGTVPEYVTVRDLVTLAVGISLATEHTSDPAAQAKRLFQIAVLGLARDS